MSDVPIRLMLDLSTAHLPRELGMGALASADGVTAYAMTHGFLMWVPDDPAEYADNEADAPPAEVLAVQLYARKHGCDYVLFDADASEVDGLPTWRW